MTHLRSRHGPLALLALFALASPAPHAAPGELYPPYGRGGVAVEPAPVGARPAYATLLGGDPGPAVVVAPDGSVLTARAEGGRCRLDRLGVDGLGGLAPLGDPTTCTDQLRPEVSVGTGGEILFVYAPDAGSIAIQRRRPDGSLETRFDGSGTVVLRPTAEGVVGRCFAMLLSDGDVMVAVNGATTSAQSNYSTLLLIRLNPDGTPDAWGAGGVVRLPGFEWGPLGGEGVGVNLGSGGVTLFGSGSVNLYGPERFGFFRQSFSLTGAFYPYFPPETSVDADSPVLSEFNDGSLAALFTFGGELLYDGPAARFAALPVSAFLKLRLPASLAASGSRVTPLRFRPLADGGLLLSALHEETTSSVAHGQIVLLRFLPGGQVDAGFGVDGVVALDLALGGPPYALPRTLSAPTLIGQDRVMLAGWGADRLGAVSVQMRALTSASGTLGWLARDGQFVTATDATDATLRFRVARHGGRRGAVGVNYRSAAPPALAGRFTPVSGRLDWADGDDTPREVAIALRAPLVEGTTGAIDLVLESAAGDARLGSAVQQVAIVDYSGGTLAFERRQASVGAAAGTLRLAVTRSGSARGAITATIRVPLPGNTGRRAVTWADGEGGTKYVDLPFDAGWDRFVAELEAPPRTRLGTPGAVAVSVTAAATSTSTPAATLPPASTVTATPAGSGGGSFDLATLGLLLAALRAATRRLSDDSRTRRFHRPH